MHFQNTSFARFVRFARCNIDSEKNEKKREVEDRSRKQENN